MDNDFPLITKYRPKSFKTVIGHTDIVASIEAEIRSASRARAYLLSGPRGCGKTTIGRIIARELGAKGRDLIEIDLGMTGGKERAREIGDDACYSPMESDAKVYLLDECQESTKHFQDAVLKVVEEPPSGVYFVFCTTEPEKLLPTIISRCSCYSLKKLDDDEIRRVLKRICLKEELDVSEKKISAVIREADGDCRAAIKMLGMIGRNKNISVNSILSIPEKKAVSDLCLSLLKGENWATVSGILEEIDEDPERVRYAILGYMNSVISKGKRNDRAWMIMGEFMGTFIYSKKFGLSYACYAVVNAGRK